MKPSETTYIFTSEEWERGCRRLQGPPGPGATIVKKKGNNGDWNLPEENIPFRDESKNKENSGRVLYLKYTHTQFNCTQRYKTKFQENVLIKASSGL